jgi:hypothetical protein
MYVTSDQECAFTPNSQNWDPTGSAAAAEALQQSTSAQQIVSANAGWQGLLSRQWQSFADLGPYVAYQLREGAPDTIPAAEATAGVVPVTASVSPLANNPPGMPGSAATSIGVITIPQGTTGSLAASTPGTVASGPTSAPGSSGATASSTPSPGGNGPEILRYFGYQPEYKTYTGPLPKQGTVKSLVIGGSNRPLAVGPGNQPASTPWAATGYYTASCPQPPDGVASLPWGEPDYWAMAAPSSSAADSSSPGGSSSPSGIALAVVALLFLGGAGYLMQQGATKRSYAV